MEVVTRMVVFEGNPALLTRLVGALQSEGVEVDYRPAEEQRGLLTADLNQVAVTIVSTGTLVAINAAIKKFRERIPREVARAQVKGEDAAAEDEDQPKTVE